MRRFRRPQRVVAASFLAFFSSAHLAWPGHQRRRSESGNTPVGRSKKKKPKEKKRKKEASFLVKNGLQRSNDGGDDPQNASFCRFCRFSRRETHTLTHRLCRRPRRARGQPFNLTRLQYVPFCISQYVAVVQSGRRKVGSHRRFE